MTTKPRTAAEIAAHAEWLARHEQAAADAFRRRTALWEAEHDPVKPPEAPPHCEGHYQFEYDCLECVDLVTKPGKPAWDDLP